MKLDELLPPRLRVSNEMWGSRLGVFEIKGLSSEESKQDKSHTELDVADEPPIKVTRIQ